MKFTGQVSLVGSVVIVVYQGLPCEWELLFKKTSDPSFKVIRESEDKHSSV